MGKLFREIQRVDLINFKDSHQFDRMSSRDITLIHDIKKDLTQVGLYRLGKFDISIRKYEDEWFTIFNFEEDNMIIADTIYGVIEYLKSI